MKRVLVEMDSFAVQAQAPEKIGRRADEFLEGAKWLLEREAEKGRRLNEDPALHALDMQPLPDHPPLSLIYSIVADKILLLSLRSETPDRAPNLP